MHVKGLPPSATIEADGFCRGSDFGRPSGPCGLRRTARWTAGIPVLRRLGAQPGALRRHVGTFRARPGHVRCRVPDHRNLWRMALAGVALVPYHFGQLTIYTLLGAAVGAATALFTSISAFAWLSGAMLVVAADLVSDKCNLRFCPIPNKSGDVDWMSRPTHDCRRDGSRLKVDRQHTKGFRRAYVPAAGHRRSRISHGGIRPLHAVSRSTYCPRRCGGL